MTDRIDDHELRALLRRADFDQLTWGQVAAAAVRCPTCHQQPGRPCLRAAGGLVAKGRRIATARADAWRGCGSARSLLGPPGAPAAR